MWEENVVDPGDCRVRFAGDICKQNFAPSTSVGGLVVKFIVAIGALPISMSPGFGTVSAYFSTLYFF